MTTKRLQIAAKIAPMGATIFRMLLRNMGWVEGFEPSATGTTIQRLMVPHVD